jgi:hypothetical protein
MAKKTKGEDIRNVVKKITSIGKSRRTKIKNKQKRRHSGK